MRTCCRWILWLSLLWPVWALANNVSRYWPEQQTQSPALWLGFSGAESLAQLTALRAWLPLSAIGERPYPEQGLSVSLVAVVPDAQGQLVPKTLFAPQPLLAQKSWPTSQHDRHVQLFAASWVDVAASNGSVIYFQLPWLAQWSHSQFVTAALSLPLAQIPSTSPDYQLALMAACQPMPLCLRDTQPLWQMQAEMALSDGQASIDFISAMSAWQHHAADGLWWRLQADDTSLRWQTWSTINAAHWVLGWQRLSHSASGLARLQEVLDSLLLTEVSQPLAMSDDVPVSVALEQATTGSPPASEIAAGVWSPPPISCARNTSIMVSSLNPDAAANQLSSWRDRALAPLPTLSQVLPRQFFGQLSGADMVLRQAVPGQRLWPANHHFAALSDMPDAAEPETALVDGGLVSAWQHSQESLWWLRDVGSGLPLQATDERFDLAIAAGVPIFYRADNANPYIFWADPVGRVLLVSAESGQVLWAWLPTQLAEYRQSVIARLPIATSAELEPAQWQLWPSNESAALAPGVRYLIGLIAGELLALDVTQVLAPWQLLQVPDGQWGSASLISAGHELPALLLAAGPEKTGSSLQLYDLASGEMTWFASEQTHVDLQGYWLAPWSDVIATDGRVRSYGLDSLGQLWRLSTGAQRPPILQRIAQLPTLPTHWLDASTLSVSVAWSDGMPLLAVMTSDAQHTQQIYTFVDMVTESGEALLSLNSLPLWPSNAQGWRYVLPQNERLRQPLRWYQHQLLVVTGVLGHQAACAPMQEHARIRRLPWRHVAGAADVEPIDSVDQVLSKPVVNAQGDLLFVGQSSVTTLGAEAVPTRVRIRRQQLRP